MLNYLYVLFFNTLWFWQQESQKKREEFFYYLKVPLGGYGSAKNATSIALVPIELGLCPRRWILWYEYNLYFQWNGRKPCGKFLRRKIPTHSGLQHCPGCTSKEKVFNFCYFFFLAHKWEEKEKKTSLSPFSSHFCYYCFCLSSFCVTYLRNIDAFCEIFMDRKRIYIGRFSRGRSWRWRTTCKKK